MTAVEHYAGYAKPGIATRSGTGLLKFLLVVFIIGYHTKLSLYSGATVIFPLYLCLLPAAVIAYRYRNAISAKAFQWLLAALVLAIVVLLGNSVFGLFSFSLLTGTLHFCASFFLGIFVIAGLARVPPNEARKLFFVLWMVFAVLAGLELIDALRPLYTAVTGAVYFGTPRGLYGANLRDIDLYGHYRPRAFASEPSFLSATLSALSFLTLFSGLAASKGRIKALALFGFMTVVAYLIVPSLSVLFYFAAIAVWIAWPRSVVGKGLAVLMLVGVAIALPLVQGAGGSLFGAHQSSGSFFGRITAGPLVGLKALMDRPILGYGIGNSDAAYDTVVDVWMDHGGFSAFPWFKGASATALMSNGFWWQWIYLGLIGGLVFTGFLVSLLKSLGVKYPLRVIVCTWIIWYAGTGFETIIAWFIFAIFAYADIAQNSQKDKV